VISVEAASFVETKQYRRFCEFCDAVRKYRYIGLCYGPPGVGKTLSARQYARWDKVMAYNKYAVDGGNDKIRLEEVLDATAVFYTVPSGTNGPRDGRISQLRERLSGFRREAVQREKELQIAEILKHDLSRQQEELRRGERWVLDGRHGVHLVKRIEDLHFEYAKKLSEVKDPTDLILMDEADRLRVAGLDKARDIYDRDGIGLVLIGMPGLEKSLARYPQLYSRIGFVHEFRPLTRKEVRQLLEDTGWWPHPAPRPDGDSIDEESIATIIRITGGNFRLLHRLLTQIGRVMEINQRTAITPPVIEAARESLVIGTA
jgi:DNA transposition AAA+ family ATPase